VIEHRLHRRLGLVVGDDRDGVVDDVRRYLQRFADADLIGWCLLANDL
jgi:hypothetical protein